MSPKAIGIAATGADSHAVLAQIKRAEELGITAAWLTSGVAGIDALTLFAGVAVQTERILLGTAIVPTYPRHPVVMAQQASVIGQLAPGRFRLGIGSSHRPTMVDNYGVNFRAPLGHLREYLEISKKLLRDGSVDFDGSYYTAHARIPHPVDMPVMASALQPRSFEICGAESDGAISWVCPGAYLKTIALPAMQSGAKGAGRPVPPLITHAPIAVHENADEVREAVREQIMNPRLPFYQRMFAAAGFPEASSGTWSDGMIDATVLWGNESQVAEKLEGLFAMGSTEVLVTPVLAGSDRDASRDRTLRLLGEVAKSG